MVCIDIKLNAFQFVSVSRSCNCSGRNRMWRSEQVNEYIFPFEDAGFRRFSSRHSRCYLTVHSDTHTCTRQNSNRIRLKRNQFVRFHLLFHPNLHLNGFKTIQSVLIKLVESRQCLSVTTTGIAPYALWISRSADRMKNPLACVEWHIEFGGDCNFCSAKFTVDTRRWPRSQSTTGK